MKFFNAQQLRDWDAFTLKHEPISSIKLMKRAADMASAIMSIDMEEGSLIYVFCGCGNNGGDGLVVAQNLSELFDVQVFIVNGTGNETPEFRHYLKKLKLPVKRVNTTADLPELDDADYIVDAIFGSGLSRPVTGPVANIINEINDSSCYILSVDIPSGLMADMHDHVEGTAIIHATETYTFQQHKPSMLLPETGQYCGQVYQLPIGLHPDFDPLEPVEFHWLAKDEVLEVFPNRKRFSHKGDFGHALLVAGSKGKAGAAIFAAKAASKSGCGLLSVECGKDISDIMQLSVPEAMLFEESMIPKITAVGCGPGLGTDDAAKVRLKYVLENFDCQLVFDADALNLFAKHKDLKIPEGSILTPHVGEFDRLFGASPNSYRRLMKAMEEATKRNIIIVLKGAYTVTCCPGEQVFINGTGNPAMAKGGSGDVLTGLITGFAAKRIRTDVASSSAVFLHGLAADLYINANDMESMTATDLIDYIPDAFRFLHTDPADLLPDEGFDEPPGFSMN